MHESGCDTLSERDEQNRRDHKQEQPSLCLSRDTLSFFYVLYIYFLPSYILPALFRLTFPAEFNCVYLSRAFASASIQWLTSPGSTANINFEVSRGKNVCPPAANYDLTLCDEILRFAA